MRHVNTMLPTLLAILCPCFALTTMAQSIAPARPIFHRERSFRIPYEVDPAQQPRIKEVQLFVSTDRGGSWRHYTSGPAPQGKEFFTFTANSDGDHWFTVRTVDFEGRGDPPSLTGVQPQLLVVVDTTPPQIDLRGSTVSAEEAGIEWRIYDGHLDLSTLRVEYRVGSPDWFAVNVPATAEGKSRFRPGVRGPIEIRLRVLDRAGNEAVEQVTLQSAGVTAMTPTTPYPTPQGSSTSPGVPAFGAPPTRSATQPAGQGGFTVPPPPSINPRFPQGSTPSPPTPTPYTPPMPPSEPSTYPTTRSSGDPNLYQQAPAPAPQASTPPAPQYSPPATGQPVSMPLRGSAPSNLQLINSTKFGVNYEIAEIGRSGLGAVALYWTYDANTWNYHGDDEDRETPFMVDVDGEGTFGFKLIGRSQAGLSEDPPRAGDRPDVWVEVDLTPPEIDLPPPQPGRGASSGILDIQWQARDKNPAPKPVSLFYAEEASGPFVPIAEEIENSGRFRWKIPDDPSMPYKFYVRIECKDRAGNVGRADTVQPVVVDLVRPQLRILTVEPRIKASEFEDLALPD